MWTRGKFHVVYVTWIVGGRHRRVGFSTRPRFSHVRIGSTDVIVLRKRTRKHEKHKVIATVFYIFINLAVSVAIQTAPRSKLFTATTKKYAHYVRVITFNSTLGTWERVPNARTSGRLWRTFVLNIHKIAAHDHISYLSFINIYKCKYIEYDLEFTREIFVDRFKWVFLITYKNKTNITVRNYVHTVNGHFDLSYS